MREEGTAPGVAQGAGMACRCTGMRGTVPPCQLALLKYTRLLIRVRPCGPSSTISERRSRSKMAQVNTFCSQGRGNWLCAWQVREQIQVLGHEPRLDAHTALVRAIIHHPTSVTASLSQRPTSVTASLSQRPTSVTASLSQRQGVALTSWGLEHSSYLLGSGTYPTSVTASFSQRQGVALTCWGLEHILFKCHEVSALHVHGHFK